MKIEIASGESPTEGYIHTDIRKLKGIDIVCSTVALPFRDNSIDILISHHVLEHLTKKEGQIAIREWARVLNEGGKIGIGVPDIEMHLKQYWVKGISPWGNITNKEHALRGLYGFQEHDEDLHKWGYSYASLKSELEKTGFANVERIPVSKLVNLEIVAYKRGGVALKMLPLKRSYIESVIKILLKIAQYLSMKLIKICYR